MEKYKEILKYVISLLAGGIVVALLMKKCGSDDTAKVNLYEHLLDTIKFYKDKDGKSHAKISTLEDDNTRNFLSIKSKDQTIKDLQFLVENFKAQLKGGGSATILGTETNVTKTTSTTVVKSTKDSLKGNSLACNPTYSTSYSDKWIKYEVTMNKDSTNFGFTSTNKYSIVVGSERKNKWKFWTKKESFCDVSNENPYDKTKTLRTFNVKQKKERVSIGIQGGYGITLYGVSPYLGFGIQFKLIAL